MKIRLEKLSDMDLLLVTHRISTKCILNAKSDLAKTRLVQVAMYMGAQSAARFWI